MRYLVGDDFIDVSIKRGKAQRRSSTAASRCLRCVTRCSFDGAADAAAIFPI